MQHAVTVEEYLSTSYEPDCDYVDGQLEDRNAGERQHSSTMTVVGSMLHTNYPSLHAMVVLRLRVATNRYRVADIAVFLDDPLERIPSTPPFLCVEVVSPEDRMTRVLAKMNDYLAMGVRFVWVLDPETRQAYVATPAEGLREVKSGVLTTSDPVIEVPLVEVCEGAS